LSHLIQAVLEVAFALWSQPETVKDSANYRGAKRNVRLAPIADIAANREMSLAQSQPSFLTSAHFDAFDAGLGICPAFKNRVSGQCYRSGIGDRWLINDGAFLGR
jgi:hypothetical protein